MIIGPHVHPHGNLYLVKYSFLHQPRLIYELKAWAPAPNFTCLKEEQISNHHMDLDKGPPLPHTEKESFYLLTLCFLEVLDLHTKNLVTKSHATLLEALEDYDNMVSNRLADNIFLRRPTKNHGPLPPSTMMNQNVGDNLGDIGSGHWTLKVSRVIC
jgi:hypothetical protein